MISLGLVLQVQAVISHELSAVISPRSVLRSRQDWCYDLARVGAMIFLGVSTTISLGSVL